MGSGKDPVVGICLTSEQISRNCDSPLGTQKVKVQSQLTLLLPGICSKGVFTPLLSEFPRVLVTNIDSQSPPTELLNMEWVE